MLGCSSRFHGSDVFCFVSRTVLSSFHDKFHGFYGKPRVLRSLDQGRSLRVSTIPGERRSPPPTRLWREIS